MDFLDILDTVTGGIFGLGSTGLNIAASRELQEDAQEFQRDEWTRQFNLSNQRQDELISSQREYESPAAYMQRLRKAGLNPSALLQSGGSLLGQQVSPSVNMPSGVTSPHFTPADIGFGQHFEAFGNFVKAMADAKKSGLDSELLRQTFDDNIRLLREKVFSQQLENYNKELDNYVNNEIKDVKVKRAFKDYDYLCTLEQNARFLGENVQADTSLKAAKELLTIAEKNLSEQQYQELSIIVRNKQRLLDSEITRNYASASASQASAAAFYAAAGMYQSQTEYNYALAQTENQMRDGKITLQQLQSESMRIANTIGSSNMRTFVATEQDRLKALVSEYERQGFITETARANMQQAITNANWSEVEKYLGAMSQALHTVTGVYNAGSMRIGSMSQMQRNQVQSEFNRILDSHWQPNEPKPIQGFGYNVNP